MSRYAQGALIALVSGATTACIEVARPPQSGVDQTELPKLTVTAVVPAEAFSLQPRVETEESFVPTDRGKPPRREAISVVVLPLPPGRENLRRVDVWLAVAGHDDGKLADRQH